MRAEDALAAVVAALLVSTSGIAVAATETAASMVVDQAQVSSLTQQSLVASTLVADDCATSDALASWLSNLQVDQSGIADALAATIQNALSDSSTMAVVVSAPVDVANNIVDSPRLSDEATQFMVSLVLDAVAVADPAVEVRTVVDLPIDGVTVSVQVTQANLSTQLVVDRSAASSVTAGSLTAVNVVLIETFVRDELYVPGGVAWTALAETWGMSRYSGLDVNSIAEIDGTLYVAGSSIFALRGDTDNGAQVPASILTAIRDIGPLARPRYCYAGYTSNGGVAVTVTGAEDGTPETYTFPLPARPALSWPTPGRAKLGRGMRSRYYQFGFSNQTGAQFTLLDLRIMVDEAARRV
jgi:hypothetical protein